MAKSVKRDEFISIANSHGCDATLIRKYLEKKLDNPPSITTINSRIANYRREGLLPLDSGNTVDVGQLLKKTSTYYDSQGQIKAQWVTAEVTKAQQLEDIKQACTEIAADMPVIKKVKSPKSPLMDDLATLYVSNDIHFGALMCEAETGAAWNTEKAYTKVIEAYDYLFETSPNSKVGIVADLGDLTEIDDFTNATPKSKNALDVDSRYHKVLRVAYKALIYAVNKALEKHETVYFYNIAGNHDISSGHAVREIIMQTFADNPRVIVDDSPSPIKYHQHGKTLLGFAHGDGLKMAKAGEVMAHDCENIFSETKHRFFHFGHFHKDIVQDGPICKAEAHRNLPPVNAWAHHKGYRRGIGTMKSITYSLSQGEKSRNLFTLDDE